MIQNLLTELHERGIRLRFSDGRLDVVAPTGALTPQLADRLRSRRGELLDMLMRATVGERPSEITSAPQDRYEPFPLTDLQHAYWVGRSAAMDLGGVACQYYFELERAGLDLTRLSASLDQVVRRHDMLRAVIGSDGQQRILPDPPAYRIETVDLRGLSPTEREARLAQIRAQMDHLVRPTDRWPLFDVRVSQMDHEVLRLHIGVDVIVLDGSSLYLLFREWRRFYEEPDWDPEPLPVSYRDYVLHEVAARDGDTARQDEKYWLDRLDDLPPAPTPPLAGRTAGLTRARFTRRDGKLAAERWSALKETAQKRGLTPSTVLMAGFAEVLRLWSQQPEFTLNLTLFNRPQVHQGINGVIGDFSSVTMLAVRSEPEDTFAGRAERIQQQLMRDLEHQSFSGVRLLRERNRRMGGGPGAAMPVVFSSALFLASTEDDPSEAIRFFGERVHGISQTPQVWLDHQVAEEQGELVFSWDAVEELFPERELDDMFAVYHAVLDRLIDGPQAWEEQGSLAVLPSWQRAERESANATAAVLSSAPTTLGQLVEAQFATRPDATAVIAADQELTYHRLVAQARRLARRLRSLGAAPNSLVAVVMPKGAKQIASVLGTSLSGAGYLPVDPQWPQARRQQILEHADARIVVTTQELKRDLVWPPGLEMVTPDDPEVLGADDFALDPLAGPDDLAYVIFTSGSTGRPKGVAIDHAAAVNTILDINHRFHVGPTDRVLALSALTFDLSVYDIFGLLAAGGTVVVPAPTATREPEHWSELVKRHQITVWDSVPALMQLWTEADRTASSPPADSIRLVLLSGDWIPVRLPAAVRTKCRNAEIHSLGGATEASIWSVCFPIPAEVPEEWVSIPYGKPLANQEMYLFGADLTPSPVWTTGEIYIGGAGLARGYWRDEQRTAERFLAHPQTGERLYRTGDLGRYRPGGDIEFLGREDSQVKINGYRIELGEIAAALRSLPQVDDAVVGVDANPENGRRALVAHIVPAAVGAAPTTSWQPAVAAGENELRAGIGDLAPLLAEYQETSQALEELCPAIMARALAELGAFRDDEDSASGAILVERFGLKPSYTGLLDRWLSALAIAGWLRAGELPGHFRRIREFDQGTLDAELTERLAGLRADPGHAALLEYLVGCADNLPSLLRGKVSPLELLLPGGDNRVTDALYATNPMARLQNRVVARVIRAFVDTVADGRPARVLEVGAGTGSTTRAVLPVLAADRTRYSFTDISTFFTARAKAAFTEFTFVDYGRYDIDRDPADQNLTPGTVDVVLAANVMHDAKDIDQSLRHLRTVMAPGGLLVLIEGTANSLTHLISVGFIEGLAQDHGPGRLPLLSVPQWRERVLSAGFSDFRPIPQGAAPLSSQPQHVLVGRAPGGLAAADPDSVRRSLERLLPDYMVPRHFQLIDHLPLTSNGKVNRADLPSPWHEADSSERVAPRDQMEQKLYDIWRDTLEQEDFGVEDDFFVLGGDSLHAVTILSRLRDELGLEGDADEGLEFLFDNPTIAELCLALRGQGAAL